MPPESALMDDLLLHRGFRDALQDSLRGGSTIGAKGTSRFDTRIDWILLPSLAEWEGECCKTDQCCDSTSVNEVAIRSATEESIYITALPSKIQVKQNSYRVIDTRHTITDHNMVICTIIFGNAGL